MNQLIGRPVREIIPWSGSGVEASKVTRIQSPRVEVVALSDTGPERGRHNPTHAGRFVWNHFRICRHFHDRDRLDGSWMAQLLAGRVRRRFRRFDHVQMDGLRAIFAAGSDS
jgi:hypothetical protein